MSQDGTWQEVSPGKASRSPVKQLEFGRVSILSKSRFALLREEEEGEISDKKGDINETGEETEMVETGADEEKTESEMVSNKEKEATTLRQSLPRGSKTQHKYLSGPSVQKARNDAPCDLNKKKLKRND